jgi:S-(hydroxymethyl)glutathione dehydrogenase/alcohol dehydrogenase
VAVGVPRFDQEVSIPGMAIVLQEKQLIGSMYGSAQVKRDFPRLISLVEQDKLDIGDMVSRTIKLDEINDALKAMQNGDVIRSVIKN